MSSRPVIAVLAPEPIRPRMAGMGIRALELARTLGVELDARLLVPNDPAEAAEVSGEVPLVHAPPRGDLAAAAAGASAAVVSGHAANFWFHQAPDVPVAVDLYDPFPIENLHYAETLGEETARHDFATLHLALARADFFLCASPEQRLFYAGALFAAGRIGATNFPADPQLAELLAVVPFGVPARPAAGDRAAGRRAAGVPEAGPLVLFGGIYDWSDPVRLLDAWPLVRGHHPDARLLFLDSPNPGTTPQRVYADTRARARGLDPESRSIFFSPWIPYSAREDLYAAADLIVSISAEGLETDLAYRTRLLDAAWGGVPSVSVSGGALARELADAGAGWRVEGSAEDLARAIVAALSRERCSEAARAARAFAAERSWARVARPLVSWCERPCVDENRLPYPAARETRLWKRLTRRVLSR
ncbi:MAG TPA: glycosyltransferase [Thermoanaerobaculia bacterium]|jgi:glycosyltransferase involved in cell wall biosynthesis